MKFGFIGPAYTGRAKVAAAEQCINLFPEKVETAEGKASMVLLGTPGLSLFANTGQNPGIRGIWTEPQSGRTFAVTSYVLVELSSNGTVTQRGNFNEPQGLTSPVTMRSNGTQLVISSNGQGYVYTLATNVLKQLNAANFPFVSNNQPGSAGFPGANQFEFFDTYLLALNPGTQQFFVSFVNDATDWAALNFASKSSWPDNLISMLMNKRELWLMGTQRGECWWDAGLSGGVPFERLQGASIETGCVAQMTLQRCDAGVFWLGGNEHGVGIAYRNEGYEAKRISNHALEYIWSTYGSITDAEGFTEQHGGHTFYVLNFPTGDATWVYDCATGLWHQRAWWDPVNGGYHQHLARCHTYAFGKHLVGDRSSGNIYSASLSTYTDNGNPIRRLRSCPVFQEQKWLYYRQLAIYILSGQADGVQGAGTEPLCYLRLSDDGGFTWGNPFELPMGSTGQYGYRMLARNLGRSRDRVFEWSTSEPIPIALVEAYLDAAKGTA